MSIRQKVFIIIGIWQFTVTSTSRAQLSESWYSCEHAYDNVCCGYLKDLITLSDENFLASSIEPFGALVKKFDKQGTEIWRDTFVVQNDIAYPLYLQEDTLGNIYFTLTNINESKIVKLEPNGQTIWSQTINAEFIFGMDADAQNGIYLLEEDTLGYLCLIKMTNGGNVLWNKIIDSSYYVSPKKSCIFNIDGSIIISYQSDALGNIVVKYNKNGDYVWSFSQPYRGNIYDDNHSGNFFINQYTYIGFPIEVDKYDSAGALLWSNSWEDSLSILSDLKSTLNGDVYFITTGLLTPIPCDSFKLFKLNSSGEIQWIAVIHDSINPKINVWQMNVTQVGQIYVSGMKTSPGMNLDYSDQFFVTVFDTNGNMLSQATHIETNPLCYHIEPAKLTSDNAGNIIVGGTLRYIPNTASFTAGFINQDYPTTLTQPKNNLENSILFPNPFSESSTLQLTESTNADKDYQLLIFDVLGNQIRRDEFRSDSYLIERGNLPEGIYFYRVQDADQIAAFGKFAIAD